MTENEFVYYTKELGIDITDDILNKLTMYYELLVTWNEKMNLTGITDKKDVYLKHFYDSLTMCKVIDLNKENTLCDIGTGAGFPGMVIKICFPHIHLTLVDSLNKRLIFLKEVVNILNLDDVEIIHARAEDYALKNRELFDIVTARAVASTPILLEYCIPLVKENKYFIALKGKEDIKSCENALNKLNCVVEKLIIFELPFEESTRTIIKIKKNKTTSLKYPRKYNEMKKYPL